MRGSPCGAWPIEYKSLVAQETRLWVAVIAVLLLAEVGMHEIMHRVSSLWGLLFAAVIFGASSMTLRYYRRVRRLSWIVVTGLLSIIGFSVGAEAIGLELLSGVDFSSVLVLGADGPTHGILAVGHLFADFSGVGIGIYQLTRWFHLRNTGVGLIGIASLTGCCGTTAILLAPVFTAVLAVFGVHSDASFVILAALLTAALIAIAYAWTGWNASPHTPPSPLSPVVGTSARTSKPRPAQNGGAHVDVEPG